MITPQKHRLLYMRYYKFGRPQLQPSFNHKDPGMKSRFENYCNQLGFDQMLLMVQEYAQHCCIRGILYWRIIKGEKTQTFYLCCVYTYILTYVCLSGLYITAFDSTRKMYAK